jgi:peptidyl-prolyl cis-trans isomerase A (cyclophilin A)
MSRLATWMTVLLTVSGLAASAALAAPDLRGPELAPDTRHILVLHTALGPVVAELFDEAAPETVRNIVNLAEGTRPWQDPHTRVAHHEPYFDGQVLHAVEPAVSIRLGCPLADGTGGPGYTIPLEIDPATSLTFDKGDYLLAMESVTATEASGSRFYITTRQSKPVWRNLRDVVFGEVIDGRGVVDAIATLPRGEDGTLAEPVELVAARVIRVARDAEPDAWRAQLAEVKPTGEPKWTRERGERLRQQALQERSSRRREPGAAVGTERDPARGDRIEPAPLTDGETPPARRSP